MVTYRRGIGGGRLFICREMRPNGIAVRRRCTNELMDGVLMDVDEGLGARAVACQKWRVS